MTTDQIQMTFNVRVTLKRNVLVPWIDILDTLRESLESKDYLNGVFTDEGRNFEVTEVEVDPT